MTSKKYHFLLFFSTRVFGLNMAVLNLLQCFLRVTDSCSTEKSIFGKENHNMNKHINGGSGSDEANYLTAESHTLRISR